MPPRALYAIAAAIAFIILGAALLIVLARGRLRAGGGGGAGRGPARGGRAGAAAGAAPAAADAQVLGEILRRRGLATEAQLAGMSAREVQMLYDTVTAKLPPAARTPASPSAETAVLALNRPVQGRTIPIGRVFCPICAAVIDAGIDRPRFAVACPGCSARLSAQLLGVRLTVTVEDASRGRSSATGGGPGGGEVPRPEA